MNPSSSLDIGNNDWNSKVRIEGKMIVLNKDSYADLYEKDKLFCKIRAYICQQDKEVEWNELKAQHDQLLNEFRQRKTTLPMPDHWWVFQFHSLFFFFFYRTAWLSGIMVFIFYNRGGIFI